jgi:hypothetical protein
MMTKSIESAHQLLEWDNAGNMVIATGYPVMIVVVIAEIVQTTVRVAWLSLIEKIFRCMMKQRKEAGLNE